MVQGHPERTVLCPHRGRGSPFLRHEADIARARGWVRGERLAAADDGFGDQRSQPLPECDLLDPHRRAGQHPEGNLRRPGPRSKRDRRNHRLPRCGAGDVARDPRCLQAGQRCRSLQGEGRRSGRQRLHGVRGYRLQGTRVGLGQMDGEGSQGQGHCRLPWRPSGHQREHREGRGPQGGFPGNRDQMDRAGPI